jgi:hypothetical protein
MRTLLALALLASAVPAVPAFAQPATGAQSGDSQTVTVTGRRIQDYRDRLARCLARHCPVNEDVDATLALAEVVFEAGDYAEARRTVAASLDRNRSQARAFPEPVADLYRARARVARHLGRDDEAVRSTFSTLRTLEDGIPHEDYRHYTARLEVAEMMMVAGRYDAARQELQTLAAHARAGGREDVASLAELRATWISYLIAPGGTARAHFQAMANDTNPEHRMLATGAKILLARIYRDTGDPRRSDALIAEVARANPARRALIFSPPYELASRETSETGSTADVNTRIPDVFDDQWIDVGFWVSADGHVQDLETVRHRGTPDWAEPLLRSIRGRLYSPSADGTPSYRLERYTYTAPLERVTGTRIMQRSPRARVEYYDLSTGEPPPEDAVARHPPSTPTG